MGRKVSWTVSDISGSTLDTCPTSLMEGRKEKKKGKILSYLFFEYVSLSLTLGIEIPFVIIVVVIEEISRVEIVILLGRDRVEAGEESGG